LHDGLITRPTNTASVAVLEAFERTDGYMLQSMLEHDLTKRKITFCEISIALHPITKARTV
jgi:hypothetical protein